LPDRRRRTRLAGYDFPGNVREQDGRLRGETGKRREAAFG
jgi:hypothetical protein